MPPTDRQTIVRMRATANALLADAELLDSQAESISEGGYLLRLLAFEILLKAVLRTNGVVPRRNHSYLKLFRSLPPAFQGRLLEKAADRMTTSADYTEVVSLLDLFASNFTRLRYPYEAYEGVSDHAFRESSDSWLRAGAPTDDAKFVYHPEELYGLTVALQQELETFLA